MRLVVFLQFNVELFWYHCVSYVYLKTLNYMNDDRLIRLHFNIKKNMNFILLCFVAGIL